MSTPDFKQLPLEVAARDGRARRTTVAALAAASQNWSKAEGAVNRLIRDARSLRSTERRFVGEAVWSIVRRWEPLHRLADVILPGEADANRRLTLLYFLYLVLDRGLAPDAARPWLEQSDLPANPETWAAAWMELIGAAHPEDVFALRFAVPRWIVPRLLEAYGDEAAAVVTALNERAPIDLRVNIARADLDDVCKRLEAEGVAASPTPWSPWGLRLERQVNVKSLSVWREGLVDLQDEGSQLIALVTGAAPGESVADLCAGGGGKLVALAGMMEGRGRLIAADANHRRLRSAFDRMARLGFAPPEEIALPKATEAARLKLTPWAGACDVVLVDAPCSGTGAWRRHPADRWRLTSRELENLVTVQAGILRNAAELVRPGGRLVYATCSILPEENQSQVEEFLAERSDFSLHRVGEAELGPRAVELLDSGGRYMQLLPHRQQTDGFFAAVLVRR